VVLAVVAFTAFLTSRLLLSPSGQLLSEPGPAPVIHMEGGVDWSGEYRYTTVRMRSASVGEVFWLRLSGQDADLVWEDRRAFDPAVGRFDMLMSHRTAWAVANATVNGTDVPAASGALVVAVEPDGPAEVAGVEVGDIIVAIDGSATTVARDVTDASRRWDDRPVTVTVRRHGEPLDLVVTPAETPDGRRLGIQIADAVDLPDPDLTIVDDTGASGSSAGLLFALSYVDALTVGDLTGGMTVTGTGAIAIDGTVAAISGVEQKVEAAIAAGGDVFFAPRLNSWRADLTADGRIPVVVVDEFDDAIRWLCHNGGTSTVCPVV
jgi:PDZ domain-containing secreted protein